MEKKVLNRTITDKIEHLFIDSVTVDIDLSDELYKKLYGPLLNILYYQFYMELEITYRLYNFYRTVE